MVARHPTATPHRRTPHQLDIHIHIHIPIPNAAALTTAALTGAGWPDSRHSLDGGVDLGERRAGAGGNQTADRRRPVPPNAPRSAKDKGEEPLVIGSGRFRERGFGLWLKFLSAPVDRNHKDGLAMEETWAVLGFWLVGRRVACWWC